MTELPPILARRYRAIKILGKGGFSTVWHAVQIDLERDVALKVLSEKALADKDSVERFSHEAKVASRIDHPGVVPLLDYGVEDGVGYIALELIKGPNLRQRIRKGPLPVGDALLIGIGLADALAEIHRQGVIHRDLKPENVLLTTDGRPVLTDFGISKSAGSSVQTREGIIFGTPGYVAPEQLEHEKASPLSDQFSLGVILYEMIAGRRPWTADSPAEEAMERIRRPAPPLSRAAPNVTSEVVEVVMRMLDRRPAKRFESLRAAHSALQLATLKIPEDDRVRVATGAMQVERGPGESTPKVGLSSSHHRIPVASPSLTVSLPSQSSRSVHVTIERPGISPLKLAGGILAAAVVLAMATAWVLTRGHSLSALLGEARTEGAGPETRPGTAGEERPEDRKLPARFPRIAYPDCAKLEGRGGVITQADTARCEVRRWLTAPAVPEGLVSTGELTELVRRLPDDKAALDLLEFFESPVAFRAAAALEFLRDQKELPGEERFDAGLLLLRKHTAHAACIWAAYGSGLPREVQFPQPRLFLVPAAGFYPAWLALWKLALEAGWEQQATLLGDWVLFHRTLSEERIAWDLSTPGRPLLADATPGELVERDPGFILSRIWRMRRAGDARALGIWEQARGKLGPADEETSDGAHLTLRTWMALEGCVLRLLARDLEGASEQAREARRLLPLCADDPGARRLGIARWPEWRRIGTLGR